MLAWICGDVCIWKPSEKTPVCAVACQHIINEVFTKNNVPEGVSNIIIGDRKVGEWMSNDPRAPLVSATGSTRMGKAVGAAVGQNDLAFLIPCHRVIRSTGVIGEYRWGSARKRAMLAWEARASRI